MENLDALKNSIAGKPKYQLSNANVFVSPGGYHYIDYLDPVEDISPEVDESQLTAEDVAYIENSLQSNAERFNNHVKIVKCHVSVRNKRVLDIGCGGGLFLSRLRDDGAIVTGIELNEVRVCYIKNKYNFEVSKRPIENDYWQSRDSSRFDVVTLWDVIEHVNYPVSTLRSSVNVLKSGGFLFIDTPCRDSFYHRLGKITYKLSRGKFPTFLNAMYSSHKFGHKQIFSTSEMKCLFEQVGLEVIGFKKFHELSFPYSFYLKKILKSEVLVKLCEPMVRLAMLGFPVKNKMLIIGRKKKEG